LEQEDRIVLDGPPTWLKPNQALALSMAVHELGTNALKYGALSTAAGRVNIAWRVTPEQEGHRLRLRWREEGGPEVSAPSKKGFGTRLVERGLAGDLAGEVALTFEREGLVCTIDAPVEGAAAR
jgi:two-component sensor histidine kinase